MRGRIETSRSLEFYMRTTLKYMKVWVSQTIQRSYCFIHIRLKTHTNHLHLSNSDHSKSVSFAGTCIVLVTYTYSSENRFLCIEDPPLRKLFVWV